MLVDQPATNADRGILRVAGGEGLELWFGFLARAAPRGAEADEGSGVVGEEGGEGLGSVELLECHAFPVAVAGRGSRVAGRVLGSRGRGDWRFFDFVWTR